MYKSVIKPILFLFNPELVHDFMTSFGVILGKFSITRYITRLIYGYNGRDISKVVDGIKYRTPFLLSAGFDYNGLLYNILPSISLGGEEIGSVTAKKCEGNPRPRLTRIPNSKGIIVNKGLRNDGVDAIINRLKHAQVSSFVKGISIAKTNDRYSATVEGAIEDYCYSFRRLNEEKIGDYYTLNISCPNAFGGETFTTPYLLERLLKEIKKIPCDKPIYTKMPINIPWEQFDSLLKVIDTYGLNGVIIGNLNKDYSFIKPEERPTNYCGGISGFACKDLSTQLIRKTRDKYGKRFTIFGVGGVMSPQDAKDKFDAGADLVMLITGLIYEGPSLIKRLCYSIQK